MENTTGVPRDDILLSPADVELYVSGIFPIIYGSWTHQFPWAALSAAADQMETSNSNSGMYDFNRVPRGPFENTIDYDFFNITESPWEAMYEAIANATDMVYGVNTLGTKVIDPVTQADNTPRLLAFAKMMQGMGHVFLATIYDRAAIIPDDIDLARIPLLPLAPHQEVLAKGIAQMEEALAIIDTTAPFVLPNSKVAWFYNSTSSSDEMAQIIHTTIARYMVYDARTPEERAAVDWELVLEHLDQGINADWGLQGDPVASNTFGYTSLINTFPVGSPTAGSIPGANTTNSGRVRVDLKIVGPADSSSNYRNWLALVTAVGGDTAHPPIVHSPDKRIEPASAAPDLNMVVPYQIRYTLAEPTDAQMPAIRGRRFHSNYWFNGTAPFGNASSRFGGTDAIPLRRHIILSMKEINLIRAEAYLRLGRTADAVAIINATRTAPVTVGPNLDPITVDGTVIPSPTHECIPQRVDGTCGGVWDALIYEKRLLTYGIDPLTAFADMRGWGCLEAGTLLSIPVGIDQLELLGLPRYTLGGNAGAPGNAEDPVQEKNRERCGMFYDFSSLP